MTIRSLTNDLNTPIGEQLKGMIKLDWIFNKPYEKIILVAMMVWSIYSVGRFLFGLI